MIETVVIFIIVIAVLIFIHELGHFLVARAFGIRVDEFALGFGPVLYKKQSGECLYSIRAIPFGGYVKIFGETPDEDSTNGKDASRSFVNKSRPIQAAVLVAGIAFNLIFAWILISSAFMIGTGVSPSDYTQYASDIKNIRVTIVDVAKNSPAEKAGIHVGDTISTFNGKDVSNPDIDIEQIQTGIKESGGKAVLIGTTSVIPEKGTNPDDPNSYAIGIAMDKGGTLRLAPWFAVWEGAKFTWYLIEKTVSGLYLLVVGLFHADKALLSQVSGPIGIAGMVGDAAHIGFTYLLMFTAMISINLAIINLVPFPALDGGRIFFVGIESIIRKRIKSEIANTVNAVGFILLMILMVVVMYHDIITKFFSK
jgi:regulator of sigma E protease